MRDAEEQSDARDRDRRFKARERATPRGAGEQRSGAEHLVGSAEQCGVIWAQAWEKPAVMWCGWAGCSGEERRGCAWLGAADEDGGKGTRARGRKEEGSDGGAGAVVVVELLQLKTGLN